MEYRKLPRGEEQIGVIGMGSSAIGMQKEKEIIETVRAAVENGINFFDMAAGHASCFPAYGKALNDLRNKVYLQIHFGADYTTGEYGWTTNLDQIKRSIDWQMNNLKTDYIDFGFIHCLDEQSDLRDYEKGGALKYILDLKARGVVRHIGLSSHSPETANSVLDMGIVDMLMFSINPGYDYQKGEYAIGGVSDRTGLYQRCEKEGVGISVMKPFSGGQLLDEKTSPFKKALTKYQCIQYALDRPGVLTVLPGFRGKKDLEDILGFFNASAEEKDYSVIGSFTPEDAKGICVYCNHCRPCPQGLNIGLINKYYDLAKAGDKLAAEHYKNLEVTAESCVQCGHCDKRCPFHANQSSRMKEIAAYFGNR